MVFISYSHKDAIWKNRLLPFIQAYVLADFLEIWDDTRIDAGDTWYPEITSAMDKADIAVCLISEHFLASDFCVKEEVSFFLEKREEKGMLLIPVLLRKCPWQLHDWLKQIQMLPGNSQTVADFNDNWAVAFDLVSDRIMKFLNNPQYTLQPAEPRHKKIVKIDLSRMPMTGMELFGRQKEMTMLDAAWQEDDQRVVSLVAWGGVGKTTLVNKWLARMARNNYRGAERVFAWSFYSQGTGERVTSADQFIREALEWFGDFDLLAGSAWEKGRRLAGLVAAQKTLLVLDGMEPLQSGDDYERGKIKDPALAMLITGLARQNPGLCLITTREEVADLSRFTSGTIRLNLDQISAEAGRSLLSIRNIQGTDAEKEAASKAFGNHALALNLLAEYLYTLPGHSVEHADKIPDLDIPLEKGKHPRRVLQAMADQMGDGPQVELLRFVGLFDRPAPLVALEAVFSGNPLPGLTRHVQPLSPLERMAVLDHLRRSKLLAQASDHRGQDLDCHPLVREHFGASLKIDFPGSWQAANHRLYDYYKNLPQKELPDTLEEMEPLFRAVPHGCQAGLHQEVFDSVYYARILRKDKYYIMKQLGAFGSWLTVIASFFDEPWTKVSANLEEANQTEQLNNAGLGLRALGRLREAAEPMEVGLALAIKQKNWKEAAIDAFNLSELRLTLGEVPKAVSAGRQSLIYADRSQDEFEQYDNRTTLADALHQTGEIREAEALFQEAEAMQQKHRPQYAFLYSLRGFRYCDLLLAQGRYMAVLERAQSTLKIAENNNWLLIMALDHLSLGRAHFLQALANQAADAQDFSQVEFILDQAVDGLRAAGVQHELPRGLLARSAFFRTIQNFDAAWRDLRETKEIAERGEMKLFLIDYHLEAARLIQAQGQLKNLSLITFCKHVDTAANLIQKTSYHRRDAEVAELRM